MKIFPLKFHAGSNPDQLLTLKTINGFDKWNVFLSDKKTGAFIDLRKNTDYPFTAVQYESPDRFSLLFQRSANGIDNEVSEQPVSVYSNRKTLIIKRFGDFKNQTVSLRVVDMTGRMIVNKTLPPAGTNRISIPAATQMVAVTVTSGNHSFTKKVMLW